MLARSMLRGATATVGAVASSSPATSTGTGPYRRRDDILEWATANKPYGPPRRSQTAPRRHVRGPALSRRRRGMGHGEDPKGARKGARRSNRGSPGDDDR